MPFSVTKAAAHIRRIVLKFNQEKLELRYNAGERYREYQVKQQKLDQEYNDLNRRLNAPQPVVAVNDDDDAAEREKAHQEAEKAYQELLKAIATARRRLADNICTVIEWWDLEGDLDALLDAILKQHGHEVFLEQVQVLKDAGYESDGTRDVTVVIAGEEKKKRVPVFGEGTIPISGLWADILPLPDEFIIRIRDEIGKDFESGGAGGKGR